MRQILCVLDFSESAAKVWEVASRIAGVCGAHLTVLFPYRLIDRAHPGDAPSLKIKLETEARLKFTSLRESTPEAQHIAVEFHPEIGFAGDRISAHLNRKKIDLVVIAQQPVASSGDLKNLNVQTLIANSHLPFLIIPAEQKAEARI